MKKVFALVLAVAMMLSLASVAFAANTDIANAGNTVIAVADPADPTGKTIYVTYSSNMFTSTEDAAADDGTPGAAGRKNLTNIAYGKTVYIPFLTSNATTGVDETVSDADAVNALKLTAKWTEGAKYVKSVEIVKKDGAWMMAIKTTGTNDEAVDVEGTLYLTGKAYDNAAADKKIKVTKTEVPVIITLEYDTVDNTTPANNLPVTSTGRIYEFEDVTTGLQDEEFELEFAKLDGVTFTVDTTHQKNLVLKANADENEDVEKANPDANMDFYNFFNATFKKTGELFIPAEEGSYLYQIVDGAVKTVNAKYDDFDEGFYITTKTLGYYVVSDIPLNVAETVAPAAEAAAPAAANPATGAAL